MGHLIDLHDRYHDRVGFLLVAIRDAGHPAPGSPIAGDPDVGSEETEARKRLIRKGLLAYKVPFPAVLDEGGEVEKAYEAYPQRLVVVGADGQVVHDGGRGASGGPSAWDLKEVEAHLDSALSAGIARELGP